MTTKLLSAFKTKITELKLIPDRGGCFELTLNGTLAYSKLSTGKFPDEKEMVSFVEKQLS